MKTEWVHKKLVDCLTIGNGYDYKHLQPGDVPVYGTGGVMTYVDNYLYDGETVCIGRKGTINHPIYHNGKIWTVDTLFYTHSFVEVIPKFIYYAFCNIDWNKYNEATGVPSLSKETIYKIEIPVPNLSAQRRIAAILASADKVIAATQKTIAKYKQMKQGMMEDLLKPKEGWKMVKLGEVCERITDGSHDSPKAIEDGYYMPSVKDMSYNCFDFSSCKQISENDYLRLKSLGCKPDIGDVLIAKDGSILKYCFVVEKDLPIVILSSIAILKPKRAIIDSHYLTYYFQKRDVVNEVVENYKSGTGVPRIVLRNFERIEITYPDTLQEQRRIAAILSGIDGKIAAEEKVLEKYEKVKKGLMERLLEKE